MPDWYGEYDLPEEKPERIARSSRSWSWPMQVVGFAMTLALVGLFIWPINLSMWLWGFIAKPEQMGGPLSRLFLWACMSFLLLPIISLPFIAVMVRLYSRRRVPWLYKQQRKS